MYRLRLVFVFLSFLLIFYTCVCYKNIKSNHGWSSIRYSKTFVATKFAAYVISRLNANEQVRIEIHHLPVFLSKSVVLIAQNARMYGYNIISSKSQWLNLMTVQFPR